MPWQIDSPWARSLIAGGVAGTTVDLSLFPLDTLKTRLQSGPNNFLKAGGFNGIYRGIGSALVGSAPGAALFFITYDSVKRATGESPVNHMLAASLGETAACLVRVPTEVVKQRTQAQQHSGSRAAFMHILRTYSGTTLVRELYRGGGVTLMREVPFTIIQFPLWEAMKKWHSGTDTIGAIPSALYGSCAGAVAAAATTPLDVLKTRLMLAPTKVSALLMFQTIIQEKGWRSLFAGVGPRTMWISIGGAIFLGSYQFAYNRLQGPKELSSSSSL